MDYLFRALFVVAVASSSFSLYTEDSNRPSLREKRGVVVASVSGWSVQDIAKYFSTFQLPSLGGFQGFSGGLLGYFTQPYNVRVHQYSPVIDAVIQAVFQGNYDYNYLQSLRDFLNSQFVWQIVQQHSINIDSYPSAGAFLNAIFQAALNRAEIQANSNWYYTLQYFYNKINYNSPAPTKFKDITFDFSGIFQAFDFNLLNSNPQAVNALAALIQYVLSDSNIQSYVQQLQTQSHYSRGRFLYAFLQGIAQLQGVPQELANCASLVLPYVVTTGVGSYPVTYKIGYSYKFSTQSQYGVQQNY